MKLRVGINTRFAMFSVKGEYYDDFSDIPMDVNGNGYMDIITGGWWGKTLRWRENPMGKLEEWRVHDIDKCGSIETTRIFDIDDDGMSEVIPNTAGMPQAFYKLVVDSGGSGTGKFRKSILMNEPSGHGLGFIHMGTGQKRRKNR